MLFSKMLCNTRKITPEEGELTGKCCVCGEHTDKGFKKKFSGNFTNANMLTDGDVICPYCNHVVRNSNEYRRTMFLLTPDEFIKFKKKEAKDIVLNLPNKPFYIYLTKTWQKIGWVMMNEVYNHDNEGTINFLIDYDIVRCDIETLAELMDFVKLFRSLKIPKTVIETGELEMYHYVKLVEYDKKNARKYLRRLKSLKNNPVFDLALFLED